MDGENRAGPEQTTINTQSSENQAEPSSQITARSTIHSLPFESDSGLSRRPRDARLLHLVLANHGVSAYQERVPLQLMDFAYRYTSSTLQDALHFTSEGYGTASAGPAPAKAAAHNDLSSITLSSLRLSIASRTHYQFNPTLPKEFYNEIAQERNRIGLPPVSREWGMRLPPEQYCLTGVGWDLKEEFDEEMGETNESGREDQVLGEGATDEGDGANENGEVGRMEDLFGNDEDVEMEE